MEVVPVRRIGVCGSGIRLGWYWPDRNRRSSVADDAGIEFLGQLHCWES